MDPWLLMIDRDGRIIATGGSAPRALMDASVLTGEIFRGPVRDAAARLMARLRNPLRTSTLDREMVSFPGESHPPVELIAAAAVPIRARAVDLAALLARALETLIAQAREKDASLCIEYATALPPRLHLDPDKIVWATATLAGTSLRYVHAGSRRGPGGTVRVVVGYEPDEQMARIVVADDGPGIPAERLRDLFSHAHATPGQGLSLLLIHDVLRAGGGTISVESSIDDFHHGTSVTMRIPAPAEALEARADR